MLMLNISQIVCHPKACSIVLAKTEIGDNITEGMIGVITCLTQDGITVTFENGELIEFDVSKTNAHFDFFVGITDRYVPMPHHKNGTLDLSNLFQSGAIDAALYQTHSTEQAIHSKPVPRH